MDIAETQAEFERFLTAKERAAATKRNYRKCLKEPLAWLHAEGVSDILHVTKKQLRKYGEHLTESCAGKLSTQSIRIQAVKALFNYLVETEQLIENPADVLTLPNLKGRLPRNILNHAEILQLLEQPDLSTDQGILYRAMFETFYSTLIRLDEMAHVNLEDVDLKGGQLFVRKGKGNKQRWTPLGKHACKFIEAYLSKVRPKLAKRSPVKTPALWLNKRGLPLSDQLIQIRVRLYGREAGFKKRITPHVFRHSGATELAKVCDIQYVAAILGHCPRTDTSRYCRVAGVDVKRMCDEKRPVPSLVEDFKAPKEWKMF